jgi:hypothetical protein
LKPFIRSSEGTASFSAGTHSDSGFTTVSIWSPNWLRTSTSRWAKGAPSAIP